MNTLQSLRIFFKVYNFYELFVFRLKSTVAKLEMTGKEAEAAALLEVAYERAMKQKKPHEAYEIEMLLVEMLIYQVTDSSLLNFLYKC